MGGKTIKCTKGVYWKQKGKSSCEDLGEVKFILSNGTEVSNSHTLKRGYKDGYSVNQTGGSSDSFSGKGGDGAFGGNGGTGGTGGSGGTGYFLQRSSTFNNAIEVERGDFVDSTILGGSSYSNPRIVIRSAVPLATKGKVIHSFNNVSNTNIILQTDGCVENVVTESMTAQDGLYGYGGNEEAKYYTITLNAQYKEIRVIPSSYTAGGKYDSTLKVERILATSDPLKWKVWFQRSNGLNTYTNYFSVDGIL